MMDVEKKEAILEWVSFRLKFLNVSKLILPPERNFKNLKAAIFPVTDMFFLNKFFLLYFFVH